MAKAFAHQFESMLHTYVSSKKSNQYLLIGIPLFAAPIFIIQWQFDKFQMYADNVAIPSTPQHWNYIHRMGENLKTTYQSLPAVFSPACIAHEVITSSDWTQVSVEGVTLPEALSCWANSLPDTVPEAFKTQDDNSDEGSVLGMEIRSQFASDDNLIFQDLKSKGQLQADQPSNLKAAKRVNEYKLARNLVRSIGRQDVEDALVFPASSTTSSVTPSGRHSSGHHNTIPNRRRKKQRRIDNNRTGSRRGGGGKRGSRGNTSKKSRKHRLIKRCREGDSRACKKLHQESHRRHGHGSSRGRKASDLVRSLDRRSSRRRGGAGGRRRNRLSQEEKRKRKARKQEQKRERRERRKKHKRLLRERRRKQRQRFKEMDQAAAAAKAASATGNTSTPPTPTAVPVHSVKTRSVSEYSSQPKCKAKLVDNCSWPHCNRSCPKLKNPETGEF